MGDRKTKKDKKHETGNIALDTKLKQPPAYEAPPQWIPAKERWNHSSYNSNLIAFLPRSVTLERVKGIPLGFNVRGGPISEYGVYVSKVLPQSEAERLGLKKGDKILSVNNVSFCDIPHETAVQMLQDTSILEMKVQYFPYGFLLQQNRIGMI